MTKNTQIKYSLILLLGAFIWGLAFVFQSSCSKYIGPYTVNAFKALENGTNKTGKKFFGKQATRYLVEVIYKQ